MKIVLAVSLVLLMSGCGGADEGASLETPATGSNSAAGETITPQAAVTNTGTTVAADAGDVSDGGTIAVPTGFVASQCVFTAALATVDGSAISSRTAVNTTSGVVTCKSVVQGKLQPEEKSCVASYTIICAK